MLIAIDGVDGAGKTTLAQGLACRFSALRPLIEKEPTDASEWGRRLRTSATEGRLSVDVEIEYFHLDRLHHIENVIRPALEDGRLVILDRYVDSTLAFQSGNPSEADKLYKKFESEILVPDFTFILDCPPKIGLERIKSSRETLSEFESVETLTKAHAIYKSRKGHNYFHIDATMDAKQVLEEVISILKSKSPTIQKLYENNEVVLGDCTRNAALA